jgi:CubicO group peptidase (beta-lactamase class C family)
MAPNYNNLHRVATQAVADGVTPGLVVAAQRAGQVLVHEAFGLRQIDPDAAATLDTVYDLASLTKALSTSLLVMRGVGQGLWDLDRPAGDVLPELATRPQVTLRRLLSHSAGFPAHRPFFRDVLGPGAQVVSDLGTRNGFPNPPAMVRSRQSRPTPHATSDGRERVLALAAAEPQAYEPGSRSIYSDLGFMLLGRLVETGMGGRLDALAEQQLFRPAGLATMGFAGQAELRGRIIAPTERCPVRGRLVCGEVHDLNAYAMGGVAGHAGLFGTAADVLRLSMWLCAAWRDRSPEGGTPLVTGEVLRLFWQPAGVPGSTWRLGWDGPAPAGSMAGTRLDRAAVGHLAFTGCSVWIDPQRETSVVMLSNRVHPTVRDDPRFRALRPAINDAVLEAIGY